MALSILIVLLGTFLTSWWLARHLASALSSREVFLLAILPGTFQGASIDAIVNNISAFTLSNLFSEKTPAIILIFIVLVNLFGIILAIYQNKVAATAQSGVSLERNNGINKMKSVRYFAISLNICILFMIYFSWWGLNRISNSCCN